MTIYAFADEANNAELPFVLGTDKLQFTGTDVAGQLRITVVDAPVDSQTEVNDLLVSAVSGSHAGHQIYLLDVMPGNLASGDFVWDSGGLVKIGDNDNDEGDYDTDGGANSIFGTNAGDLLMGLGGDDSITGRAGSDYMDGGEGADSMAGGKGNDIYVVTAGDVITEASDSGVDTIMTAASWVMDANVEKLVMLGTGALSITGNTGNNGIAGNDAANVVHASGGNDLVNGNGGNDKLWGGGGNDTVNGALGDDSLWGDAGADVLSGGDGADLFYWDAGGTDTKIAGGPGGDTLRVPGSGVTLDLTGLAGTVITGMERIELTGSGNNTLELTVGELRALSPSSDKLIVLGNAGDVVNSSGWTLADPDVSIGYEHYAEYTQGSAVLLIDTDITANVI